MQRLNPSTHDDLIQRFVHLIALRTGLHVRPEESDKLQQVITARMRWHRLTEREIYYRLLEDEGPKGDREWGAFIQPLTVGESYFFRDHGHFNLLRHRILPELIERRRSSRSLYLWSAGCASGEEPYSLAILLDELLPRRDDWCVRIFGTDINREAIAKAQRGLYSAWSLRTLEPQRRARCFHQRGEAWELDEHYRRMVTFRAGNLLQAGFPDPILERHEIDLILCRNVFIYFDRAAVRWVVAKFIQTLKAGGYLITGHAELHDQQLRQLQVRVLPEAVLYQRLDAPASPLQPDSSTMPTTFRSKELAAARPSFATNRALGLSHAGSGHAPTPPAQTSRPQEPATIGLTQAPVPTSTGQALNEPADLTAETLCGLAQAYADAGHYAQAVQCCQRALALDPLAVRPYYLLAHIAEEQGDLEAAKTFLKKILYIAPSWATAYLELAELYSRESDTLRARKMLTTAQQLLQTLPAQAPIEPLMEHTAADVLRHVEHCLRLLG